MITKEYLIKQSRLAAGATGIAVLLVLIKSIMEAVLIVKFQRPEFLFTPQINLLLVATATLIIAAFTNFNPLMSWIIGYLYIGLTLVTLNQEVIFTMLGRGVLTFVLFLLVAPIPVSLAAFIGAIVGKIFTPIIPRRFKMIL